MPSRKKIIFLFYYTHIMINKLNLFFCTLFLKEKKSMQLLEFPLQPKGHGFQIFSEFFFSFTNEMGENKYPFMKI